MTEHLPECPMSTKDTICRCLPCICDALRACEERVFALHPEWTVMGMCKPDCAACRRLTELITEWEDGYEKGLDAAREAVAALDAYYAIEECQGNPLEKGDPEDPDPWHQGHLIERDDALAAIDALREKP